MGQSVEAIEAMRKELGIPLLPPDHPEYSIGPQVHFSSRTSSRLKPKDSGSTTPAGNRLMTQPESKDNS
jgi:hypothetical protein